MKDGQDWLQLIERYYVKQGLQSPDCEQSILWAFTELCEAYAELVPGMQDVATAIRALGEYVELRLRAQGGWTRNDARKEAAPEAGDFSAALTTLFVAVALLDPTRPPTGAPQVANRAALAEELGDVIMMLLRAGHAAGVDPLGALAGKIQRKSGVE